MKEEPADSRHLRRAVVSLCALRGLCQGLRQSVVAAEGSWKKEWEQVSADVIAVIRGGEEQWAKRARDMQELLTHQEELALSSLRRLSQSDSELIITRKLLRATERQLEEYRTLPPAPLAHLPEREGKPAAPQPQQPPHRPLDFPPTPPDVRRTFSLPTPLGQTPSPLGHRMSDRGLLSHDGSDHHARRQRVVGRDHHPPPPSRRQRKAWSYAHAGRSNAKKLIPDPALEEGSPAAEKDALKQRAGKHPLSSLPQQQQQQQPPPPPRRSNHAGVVFDGVFAHPASALLFSEHAQYPQGSGYPPHQADGMRMTPFPPFDQLLRERSTLRSWTDSVFTCRPPGPKYDKAAAAAAAAAPPPSRALPHVADGRLQPAAGLCFNPAPKRPPDAPADDGGCVAGWGTTGDAEDTYFGPAAGGGAGGKKKPERRAAAKKHGKPAAPPPADGLCAADDTKHAACKAGKGKGPHDAEGQQGKHQAPPKPGGKAGRHGAREVDGRQDAGSPSEGRGSKHPGAAKSAGLPAADVRGCLKPALVAHPSGGGEDPGRPPSVSQAPAKSAGSAPSCRGAACGRLSQQPAVSGAHPSSKALEPSSVRAPAFSRTPVNSTDHASLQVPDANPSFRTYSGVHPLEDAVSRPVRHQTVPGTPTGVPPHPHGTEGGGGLSAERPQAAHSPEEQEGSARSRAAAKLPPGSPSHSMAAHGTSPLPGTAAADNEPWFLPAHRGEGASSGDEHAGPPIPSPSIDFPDARHRVSARDGFVETQQPAAEDTSSALPAANSSAGPRNGIPPFGVAAVQLGSPPRREDPGSEPICRAAGQPATDASNPVHAKRDADKPCRAARVPGVPQGNSALFATTDPRHHKKEEAFEWNRKSGRVVSKAQAFFQKQQRGKELPQAEKGRSGGERDRAKDEREPGDPSRTWKDVLNLAGTLPSRGTFPAKAAEGTAVHPPCIAQKASMLAMRCRKSSLKEACVASISEQWEPFPQPPLITRTCPSTTDVLIAQTTSQVRRSSFAHMKDRKTSTGSLAGR
ncbi:hypothetical protein DIPPA_13959 [Diplonema papillatum]|nr:hypothetical protein DIPPA_13959 [Diplonema papillatum]|eukprot:gene13452-20725_t